jgi:hypothetical protein
MDLDKRFSLDYLISGDRPHISGGDVVSPRGTSEMQQAVQVYISPVLNELAKNSGTPKRTNDVFDAVHRSLPQIDIHGFQDVLKWMTNAKLVQVVVSDPHGNDLIQKV